MHTLEKPKSPEAQLGHIEYNDYLRRRNDTSTWLSEVLDGSMKTKFDYWFDGCDLHAEDNSNMRGVFEKSLEDAEFLAVVRPELRFEQRRRILEMQEYEDMQAMMQEDLPNTMVVVSDFPAELMNAKKDVGGYNVTRKQTMLRVITKNADGTLTMRSQSLDRSDRRALENLYFELGFAPNDGELLGQRMHVQLDDAAAQALLIDHLTSVYDKTLALRYGQDFYSGRTPADRRNTADFVASQADLVETYINHHNYGTDDLQRSLAAAMTERFEGKSKAYEGGDYSSGEVEAGMAGAGKRADEVGRTFSGCGVTSSAKNQLEEAGYGNKICVEVKNGQKVRCPGCKETVKAIVSTSKETIHCSNGNCKLAHPSIKHSKKRKIKATKPTDNRRNRKKQNERNRPKYEQRKRPTKAW